MRQFGGFALLCAAAIFLAAACAARQPLVTVGPGKGQAVAITASDFKFVPNNIKAYKGDVLLLKIENTSGTGHNFTIKDPGGNTLQSVPLPSKETVTVKVELADSGTYEFYCDKPLHSTLGMKGWIQVDQ